MSKHLVKLYQETFTEIEIEADSIEESEELVMSGEFNDEDIQYVIVKNSEIM
tara:strand:+ start:3054 stop:3209 length:156 start_codon:yes stop_codon:yes gene_type:complete